MPITNRLRKTLNAAASHHSRRKNDQFIAEGLRCCREAVTRRPEWIDAIFFSDSFAKTDDGGQLSAAAARRGLVPEVISEKEFAQLADTLAPQGVLAILNRPEPTPPERLAEPFTLVLDRIS